MPRSMLLATETTWGTTSFRPSRHWLKIAFQRQKHCCGVCCGETLLLLQPLWAPLIDLQIISWKWSMYTYGQNVYPPCSCTGSKYDEQTLHRLTYEFNYLCTCTTTNSCPESVVRTSTAGWPVFWHRHPRVSPIIQSPLGSRDSPGSPVPMGTSKQSSHRGTHTPVAPPLGRLDYWIPMAPGQTEQTQGLIHPQPIQKYNLKQNS